MFFLNIFEPEDADLMLFLIFVFFLCITET